MNHAPSRKKREIFCPQCRKKTIFSSENPYRPFCSERCQMIDLGTWANEAYRIPDNEKISEFDFPDSEHEKN